MRKTHIFCDMLRSIPTPIFELAYGHKPSDLTRQSLECVAQVTS